MCILCAKDIGDFCEVCAIQCVAWICSIIFLAATFVWDIGFIILASAALECDNTKDYSTLENFCTICIVVFALHALSTILGIVFYRFVEGIFDSSIHVGWIGNCINGMIIGIHVICSLFGFALNIIAANYVFNIFDFDDDSFDKKENNSKYYGCSNKIDNLIFSCLTVTSIAGLIVLVSFIIGTFVAICSLKSKKSDNKSHYSSPRDNEDDDDEDRDEERDDDDDSESN